MIAVDDGSTDGSAAVLEDWRGRMPLVVVAQANGGASVARNVALERARGEYVYMLDADDFVHPHLLEWAVRAADAADADYVLFGSEDVRPDETAALRDRFAADGSPVRAEPLPVPPLRWYEEEVSLPVVWRFLFRRASLAGLTFPTGIMYEDNVFVYGYLARPVRGVRLAKPLYGYVQEPASVMHVTSSARKMKSIDVVMRELRGRLSPGDWAWLFLKRYVLTVKAFWRKDEEVPLLRDLTRGWFRDGIVRLGWFPFRWRLRFVWYLHGRMGRGGA